MTMATRVAYADDGSVTISIFAEGAQPDDSAVDSVGFAITDFPDAIITKATAYGLQKQFCDTFNSHRAKGASVAMATDAANDRMASLKAGEWRKPSTGGIGAAGITVRAMAVVMFNGDEVAALAKWKAGGAGMELKAWQKAVMANAEIKKGVADIHAAEAKAAKKSGAGPSVNELFA